MASSDRLGASALLAYSRALLGASDFHALVRITRETALAAVGFPNVWLYVMESASATRGRMVAFAGEVSRLVWDSTAILEFKDDPMLMEIMRGDHAVVVADATTDPRTNKDVVAALQLKTIVNVPLTLVDARLGAMGFGTFAEEGFLPLTPQQVDFLVALASHAAVALARIRLLEEQAQAAREKAELERRLMSAQRLESLGLLAGGVAHDFNNLLLVILGSAEFLDRAHLSPAQLQDVEAIRDAANRAAHLTRQLLAMSRQQRLAITAVDLNASLRELRGLLARLLPADVKLEITEGPDLPRVDADPDQLTQVLMNLCLNARDAMPAGGALRVAAGTATIGEDAISSTGLLRRGTYCLLEVQDTGTGMPPAVVERIFDPFFTTKPAGRGTGLGLAVVQGIVAQHGGHITCQSAVGKGTTFRVYLPVSTRASASAGAQEPIEVRGGDERVLVADDQAEVREVLRRTLREAGYRVTAVNDGFEALAAAQAEPFDLVILDVLMPGMNGREAWERIRPIRPEARFLFVTGHSAHLLPVDLVRDHGVAVLEKPFAGQRLLRAVRDTLGGRPGTRQLELIGAVPPEPPAGEG